MTAQSAHVEIDQRILRELSHVEESMKKLTQMHIDVSAYFFALTLTVIICLFAAAMCYIELCARDTLLNSGGLISGVLDAAIEWTDGLIV